MLSKLNKKINKKSVFYIGQLVLCGEINEESAKEVVRDIFEMNRSYELNKNDYDTENYEHKIKMVINSGGGELYSGFTIIDAMQQSIIPIDTYSTVAFSMGFGISVCGDRRYASKYANFMHHSIKINTTGVVPSALDDMKHFNKLENDFIDLIKSKTKFTNKQLRTFVNRREDFYFGSTDALKMGVIDEII